MLSTFHLRYFGALRTWNPSSLNNRTPDMLESTLRRTVCAASNADLVTKLGLAHCLRKYQPIAVVLNASDREADSPQIQAL